MLFHRLFQSRCFLLSFAVIALFLSIDHYFDKFNLLENLIFSYKKEEIYSIKIVEINDREPNYKLATYEGYQFPLERNRAQTELLNYLKLKEECQQNPNTTIIDVGASLGEFGFYAAACGCQVYMFEIEPKKVIFIEKSIKLNSFESRVHLIKKAVSDLKSNQTIYFSKKTNQQISTSIKFNKNHRDIYMTETINLNHLSFSSIFILRIDVQGHELHVFRSTEKYFQQQLVHHAIFEFTPWGTDQAFQKDIFNYMKNILGAKQFYALHPKQPIIYGPLEHQHLQLFYSDHKKQHLQRDVYVLFKDQQLTINANPYSFQTSF